MTTTYDELLENARYLYSVSPEWVAEGCQAYPEPVWSMAYVIYLSCETDYEVEDIADQIMEISEEV